MARTTKKINALIGSIKTASAKRRNDIQEALVECAMFVFEDRNTDPFKRLFAAVGNETNKKAMSHWASLNGLVHFKDEVPVLSDARQKETAGSVTPSEFEKDLRQQTPWFDFASEGNKARNVWDSVEFVKGLEAYLDKQVKKAGKEDSVLADIVSKAAAAFKAQVEREIAKCEVVEK